VRTSSRARFLPLVDHAEDALLLGDDRIQGVFLVALALVRLPGRADPHTNGVDDALDARTGITVDVNR